MPVGVSHEHNDDGRCPQQQEIHGNIKHLRINLLVVQNPPAHPHLKDRGRIQGFHDLHVDGLEQHNHAVHLEAAGSGTRTAAHQAHQDEQEARQHRPSGIVRNGKTCGRSVTHHMEGTIQERRAPAVHNALQLQGERSNEGNHHQRQAVKAQHGIVQRPHGTVHQRHKNEAEVHGGQEHEHDGEHGNERRAKCADTQVPGRKTTRGTNAERMTERIEQRHAAQPVAQEGGRTDAQVHPGEDVNGFVGPAAIIVPGKRRQLHVGEPEPDRRRVGDNEQQEHDHSQTADEMRGGTPEQQAPRQGLHIFQNGGTGCSKTGNAFKPGVYHRERTTPEGIRQRAEHKRQQPGQEDDHVAVLQGNLGSFPHKDEGENAHDEGDDKTDQERRQGGIAAVGQGNKDREQHEQRTHQERHAHIPRYDFQVHSSAFFSLSSAMRRRTVRFSSVRSVTTAVSWESWSLPSKVKVYRRRNDR